jgi:GntR family transcriptional regulator
MWRRISDDIQTSIARGVLKPGEKLPSTRELADQYQVAPGTVRKAVDVLLALGVLRGHQGRGVYVAESPTAD